MIRLIAWALVWGLLTGIAISVERNPAWRHIL